MGTGIEDRMWILPTATLQTHNALAKYVESFASVDRKRFDNALLKC
jgi:hypothetical protein